MEPLDLLKMGGTPVLLVGIIVWLERLRSAVAGLTKTLAEVKDGMVWKDTCGKTHKEVDRRLDRLERATGLDGGAR
jgi:hypothetical protein